MSLIMCILLVFVVIFQDLGKCMRVFGACIYQSYGDSYGNYTLVESSLFCEVCREVEGPL